MENQNSENYVNYVKNYISFGTNEGKGTEIFERYQKVFETQAFFPNLSSNNAIYLWAQCSAQRIEPDTLQNYNYFLNKNIKIDLGMNYINLRMPSAIPNTDVDRRFFDISQTDIPKHHHKRNKIKRFKPNEYFLNDLKKSFIENTQWQLAQAKESKTSLDYVKKILYIDQTKSIQDTIKRVILGTISLELAPTLDEFEYKNSTKEKLRETKLWIASISNAIFKTINIETIPIDAKYKQEYKWGTQDAREIKIHSINHAIQNIFKTLEIEKHFNINLAAQDKIQAKNKTDFKGESKEEYWEYKNERIKQLAQEIKANIPIEDIIGNYIELKKAGSNFKGLSPFRHEDTPSFVVSPAKQIATDFGNANQTYDSIGFVMAHKNLSFPEAVEEICNNHNINLGYEATYEEYMRLHNPTDNSKSPSPQLAQKAPLSEDIVYKVKEKPESKEYEKQPRHTMVIKTDDIRNHPECIEYLANKRGIKEYPKELVYIEGGVDEVNDKGEVTKKNAFSYKGIGYINNSGGADIRFPKEFSKEEQWKKSRTVGDKDFVVLNKENIKEGKISLFVISESAWDYTAAYNQEKVRKETNKAVAILLNGTDSQKAIDFINEHKTDNAKIIILNQADSPNIEASLKIVLGTGIQDFKQLKYNDDDFKKKADVNDLHKQGIDLSERFFQSYK